MSSQLREQLQQTLGEAYRLERELGGGGMSRVFLAVETALGRNVVVKVLLPELAAGVSVDRFRREIQLAAKLQHPHIVPLLTAGESAGLPYFTMPFVVGESLRVRLSRDHELPVPEAIRMLRDVASALDYAHGQGVVHRDIKPDNVLLTHRVAVVTDFGVAKALSVSAEAAGRSSSPGLTSMGVTLGTPTYMAPEQASADPGMDHRVDVYAFGVMAYEMLAGRPPFSARTPQAMLGAHLAALPEPITLHRPGLPPALASLIMHCLEKHPADRPQTAGQLIVTLDSMTTPSGGTVPVHAPTVVMRRRVRGMRAVAQGLFPVAAGLAAAAGAAFWVWSSGAGRPQPADAGAAAAVRPGASPAKAPVATPAARPDGARPADSAPAPATPKPSARPVAPDPARDGSAVRKLLAKLREDARGARRRATEAAAAPELIARGDSALGRADSLAARHGAAAAAEYSAAASVWGDAAKAAEASAAEASAAAAAAPAPEQAAPEQAAPPAPAPPAVPPSSTATGVAAPPVPPPDPSPRIRALFDAYAAAVETRSVANIRQAYPGLQPQQAREWERFFGAVGAIDVDLRMTRLDVHGDAAEARLSGLYAFTDPGTRRPRRDSVSLVATLQRDARGWRIQSLR